MQPGSEEGASSALGFQLFPPPGPLPHKHISFSLTQRPLKKKKKVIKVMGTHYLNSLSGKVLY